MMRGFSLIDPPAGFILDHEKILLKPNLLNASRPERAVTTHPSVFGATARLVSNFTKNIGFGDSPAVANPRKAAQNSGIMEIASALGVVYRDFSDGRFVQAQKESTVRRFFIAEPVLQCDGLISICKMKTHSFTTITGAIKNQFGCIPGLKKAEFHAKLSDPIAFSRMLVDLTRLIRPRLCVMDAITAMEGDGPGGGIAFAMNALLVSFDPFALDRVAATMMNIDPKSVPMIKCAAEQGLGREEKTQVVGDPLESFQVGNFKPAAVTSGESHRFLARIMRRYGMNKPVVNHVRCITCGQCHTICPVSPKAMEWPDKQKPPKVAYARCIRCFCCQETCPEAAIDIKSPIIARLLHIN
ncbi:DUF362 domain-containing protein [bacterium]|nr:DUF362 domain-containing protein [candidate division CSSED10-310 bacterium]